MFQIRLHVTINDEAIIIGEAQNAHVPGRDERMRIAPAPQLAQGAGTLVFRVTDIVYILDNTMRVSSGESSPYVPLFTTGEMSKVWLYLAPDDNDTWQYMNRLTVFQAQQRAAGGPAGDGGEEERREENPYP